MENNSEQFHSIIQHQEDFLLISASGDYSLTKAKNLFKLAIDSALLEKKSKVLIDINNINGSIPFMDRFEYSKFLSQYRIEHGLGKVDKIAVVGQEPIVDKEKFGENVAVNRGANARVFTDLEEASDWLTKE